MDPQTYVPGKCNIGHNEKEKRMRQGLAGVMLACGWTFLGYTWVFPIFLKILVMIPAFAGTLGFLQYNSSFCVYYGLSQKQNIADNDKATIVSDTAAVNADKQKSIALTMVALIVSFLYTMLVLLFF